MDNIEKSICMTANNMPQLFIVNGMNIARNTMAVVEPVASPLPLEPPNLVF